MSLYSLDQAQYSYITSYVLYDVFSRTSIHYCIGMKSSIISDVNHMEHYVNATEAVSSAGYV